VAAGIIGYADMTRGSEVAALLDEHIAQGGERFKGVRHIVSWDADPIFHVDGYPTSPGMLGLASVRAAFRELEKRDLCFEAMVFHHQLGEVAALAAQHDDARIVVNHIGLPLGIGAYAGERSVVFAEWRSAIKAVAACPNVAIKLGGMGMPMLGLGLNERPEAVTSLQMAKAYAPFVEVCVEAFGAERCMFESNFPVDRASGGYRTLWNAFKRIAAPCSESEQTALFSSSAKRFYRLA
jgi:predicted TIM-barrel fold metal-dependent hydrolase